MALYNYKTSNPAFSRDVWKGYGYSSSKMTVNGILLKSFFCLFLLTSSGYAIWELNEKGIDINYFVYGAIASALFLSLLIAFIHKLAPILVPLYAISIGIIFSAVAIYAKAELKGMPIQTIAVTITTFFVMLFLYKSKIVKVSERFKSVMIVAIGIIMLIYAISWTLQYFGINTPFAVLHNSSYLGVAFNITVSALAAFTLMLDFDFIERKKNHVPRYMEWVATWGLLLALLWIYVEAIRLVKRIIMQ